MIKFKKLVVITLGFSVINASLVFAGSFGRVNAANVNVRGEGSSESEIISNMNTGDAVNIVSEENGWFKIALNDSQVAYISSQFVSLEQAEAIVSDDRVNVRTAPSNTAAVVKVFNKGQVISVEGISGDWCMIAYEGQKLYIHKDFVSGDMTRFIPSIPAVNTAVSKTYALVNCSGGLNLRKEASSDSAVISTLYNGTAVDVLETLSGWVKVKLDDGTVGYLSSEFILLKEGEKPVNQVSSKAQQIIDYAKKFIGTPYSYGRTDLRSGVDCSGFVYAVFRDNGITLNRSSRDQVRNGTIIDKANLIPGDLVFFDTDGGNNGAISHVGIYIGNGQYIHSSSGKAWGVVISNLYEAYSVRTYVTAARVLK